MRIVYLATGVFDKGGISRYSRYQVRALRDVVGHSQLCVLSILGPRSNDFEEPFCVNYHGNGIRLTNKLGFIWATARACLSMQPAIIWCNHVHLLPLGLLVRCLIPTARLIVNVYGLELWSSRQWLHRRTLKRADVIVSDCHFSANFAVQHYHIPSQRLRVIWDCVDKNRFYPKRRRDDLLSAFGVPIGPQYRYVMMLGRISVWTRHKGYDRFLDALVTLKEYPDIIALLAGDGNDRPRLEQRVQEEGLTGRVFFLGDIPEAQLVDVYNLCDVFVLVSDRGHGRGEGIPLTPLEAAACGKPIIVGNEDGSQEAVVEGVNGHIVSPRDPRALREALLDTLMNPDLRDKMGQAAHARIQAEFSYEGFCEKTARILGELQYKKPERDAS